MMTDAIQTFLRAIGRAVEDGHTVAAVEASRDADGILVAALDGGGSVLAAAILPDDGEDLGDLQNEFIVGVGLVVGLSTWRPE